MLINMKRILNLVIIFVIAFFSCSKIIERRLGDWDDNIHLSVKLAEFSASGDSVTIYSPKNDHYSYNKKFNSKYKWETKH